MQFNCWKIDSCDNKGCPCSWHEHLVFLCEQARIPEHRMFTDKLKTVNAPDFERYINIKSNIVDFIDQRNSLDIIVSSESNDMVDYGIKLLLNYFSQISFNCEYKTYGLFIDIPQYVDKLRDNITLQDQELVKLKQDIDEVPVVVFNNLIPCNTEFINSILYRHFCTRANNKLTTIIVRGTETNTTMNSLISTIKSVKLYI